MSKLTLNALIAAGGNSSAARKARVKKQPRDKKGRWVVTGAALLAAFSLGDGRGIVKLKGSAIGGTATELNEVNNIRMLVGKGYEQYGIPENSVVEVTPKNAEVSSKIKIDKDFLKSRGVDPDLAHTLPKSVAEQPQDLASLNVQPADELDIELATGGLTDDEDKDFRAERDKEPLAKLPPVLAEKALKGEDVNKLVEASDVATPSTVAPKKDIVDLPEPVSGRNSVNEAYLDAFNPEARQVTLDELIDGPKGAPKTKATKALNLDKGDRILGDDGKIYEIDSIDLETGRMTLKGPDGKILAEVDPNDPQGKKLRPKRIAVKTNGEYKVVQGNKDSAKPVKPARPARPESTPANTAEAPVTPIDAESPEAASEPESVPDIADSITPTVQEAIPADRIDDGGDIVHEPLTDDQRAEAVRKKVPAFITKLGRILEYFDNNGKRKQAADPFELLNSLAEAYPNAKFTPDGDALILDRRIDKDGRIFELRASNTGSKALVYSMNWTDPETGEIETLVHYDKRHSITSVFRKDNSSDALLARLLSVEPLKLGKNPKAIPGFGEASLRDRAEWYKQKQKMFTPAEIATFYGNGRGNIFHKQTGTLKNQEVLSIWEAYPDFMDDPSDPELRDIIAHGLLGVFGRLPMDAASHKAARKQLRLEFKNRFPGENARSMGAMITNASRVARNKTYDVTDPEVRANPYASKNRVTPIEPGQTVEYINNGQDKMVLLVTGYAPGLNVNPNGEGYDYADYVYVKDETGTTYRINSIKLRILKNQSEPLTEYEPNLRGKALRDRRQELGLYGVSGDSIVNNPAAIDTIAGELDAPLPDVIDDLDPGEMLPDLNGGGMIGEIVSSRFAKNADGVEGISFTALAADGSTKVVFYALGEEIPKKD
jgi:hypothetical protein